MALSLLAKMHPVVPQSARPIYSGGDQAPNTLQTVIGVGGFGVVYKVDVGNGVIAARKTFAANDNRIQWEVAFLKRARDENAGNVLHLLLPPQAATTSFEQAYHHPDGRLSIDMEWAPLGTIKEYIANYPWIRVTEGLVAWVGRQLFSGVMWLHERNILHGDIKPDNLLCWDGPYAPYVKLGDLGSSVTLNKLGVDCMHAIARCITTYSYAAPEMLLAGLAPKEQISRLADIYSATYTLMELSGTQAPEYPRARTPRDATHEARMRSLHARRPKNLMVYHPRFKPSPALEAFFATGTAWESKDRRDAVTLIAHPALQGVQGGHIAERWVLESELAACEAARSAAVSELTVLRGQLAATRAKVN